MEKRIEDFLHLYLGCKCRVISANGYGGTTEYNDTITLELLIKIKAQYAYEKSIKPLLRPLESMTEAEMQECGNMEYDFRDDPELNKWEPSDFEIGLSPRQFHWLLSKHFDLFGLIDAGLAIDANNITK